MLAISSTACAQQTLWLSATGSTAQPPADVVGASTSTYLLLGLQGSSNGRVWDTDGFLNFGDGFQQQAGRWLSADLSATRAWQHKKFASRFSTTLNGLRYTSPFSYGAYTAQLEPAFTWTTTSSSTFTLTPRATGGFWTASGETGSIGVIGSTVAFAQSIGAATAQLSAEAHHASNGSINGDFRGLGLDLAFSRGHVDAGAGVKAWQTPTGDEWGYDAYASRTLGNALRIDVQLARSVRDPVLATPGSFGASVALNWRIAHAREKGLPQPLYTVGAATANGRHVTFSVTLASARTVSVSGSFTDWTPVAMQRKGNRFTADIVVPAGTYQFGFLVDGETWYLPPNAPGVVSDDFGRKNATLVI